MPEETIAPPAEGSIVFYSERDGNAEIYTMNPDGSDPRRLTFNDFEDSAPALSPDGSQIAFMSDRDDPHPGACFPDCFSQIYVIDADGSNEHKLVETEFPMRHPDWHPDGTRLSFDTERNFKADVYVVNADGSGLRRLIEDGFWADWSPDGTQIAFASKRDGNVEIYVADADGRNQRRLTENSRLDYFPDWSPDGRRIAFATLEEQRIYVMNADGSDEQLLTDLARSEDPCWSPDGSQIVFQSSSSGNFEIYTIHVEDALQGREDSAPRRLTDNRAGDFWPAWGPAIASEPTESPSEEAGNLIAFVSTRDGNGEIYVMNGDGSEPRRLTNYRQWDGYPTWSPDGQRIAYYSYLGKEDWVIKVMDLDGSDPSQLTDNHACDGAPRWSPDGNRIAYSSDPDCSAEHREIVIIEPDGGNPRNLTQNEADDMGASWSSDGQQIAFSSDRDGDYEIYIMDVDGSNVRQLTFNETRDYMPDWSPDGTQIAFVSGLEGNDEIYVMALDGNNRIRLTHNAAADWFPEWSPDGARLLFSSQRDGNLEVYIMDANGHNVERLTNSPGDDFNAVWQPSPGAPTTTPIPTVDSSPPAAVPLLQKSAQEFDARGTFQAALGDLDGDGDLDAVFANPQTHDSAVWLNDGRGTLVDTGQQLTRYGHGVGVADFDGDGDLDAFIACHQFVTPSRLYLNDGTGVFADSGQDLGDGSISANGLDLVDLNGDGHADVHVVYYDPNGRPDKVYLNDGLGTFTDSGLALDEETIAWGDLDGDGDVDYFGKRWGQGYVVQLNDSGQFSEGWHMEDSQATVGSVALADFDGDGDLDALVTNGFRSTGSVPSRLLWNDGSGGFSDSGQSLNGTMGSHLAAGDLDGDGDLDVFVANMDLPNEVWLNEDGRLRDSGLRLGEIPPLGYSTEPSLGDLDGDGDLDVFVGSLSGKPEIWFNLTLSAETSWQEERYLSKSGLQCWNRYLVTTSTL